MSEFIQKFQEDMRQYGIVPLEKIVVTGAKWARCKIEGDKGTKRSLAYRLAVNGDFAYGTFINHKEGVSHNWHFSNNVMKKLSQDEIGARQAAMAKMKQDSDAELAARRMKAAEIARHRWDSAAKEGEHPYIKRKGIEQGIARIDGGVLIIPIMKAGKIVSLQFIQGDGTKRLLTGGEAQGCFCPLTKPEDKRDRIAICEGYATGQSIRMATGIPVIVAFFASNLVPVAESIRAKHPNAEIIICADDDQWTVKPDGTKDNPGVRYAQAALLAVAGQGRMVKPSFANEHPDRPTDFNDVHELLGLEAVRKAIMEPAPAAEDITLREYDEEGYSEHLLLQFGGVRVPQAPKKAERGAERFTEFLIPKPSNPSKPKPDSYSNIVTFLKYHPEFTDCFFYDEFSHTIIVRECPSWTLPSDRAKFKIHPLDDIDIRQCQAALEFKEMHPSKDNVKAAIEEVARVNKIHPARDYFNSLVWDGVPRLNNWLIHYAGCEKDELEYVQAVGRKWLIAGVARIMEPGVKFDYMLVLEGNEGARKSTMLEELASIGGESYYTDAIKVNKVDENDSIIQLQGKLIVEFQEMAGLGKTDMEDLKRWITIKQDEMVGKYKSYNSQFKRQFITAGTLNPLDGWLDDPTGGRRFWPVLCGPKIDIQSLVQDKEQLWAEAVDGYRKGESLWLEGRIWDMAGRARDQRRVEHPWHEGIKNKFGHLNNISTNDVFDFLKIEVAKRNRIDSRQIGKIMRTLGFSYETRYMAGSNQKVWIVPERQTKMEYADDEIGV